MSVGGIVKQLCEFVYAMCPYNEDVINVSVLNSQLKWKGRKKEFSTYSMEMIAYASAISAPIAVPLVCK